MRLATLMASRSSQGPQADATGAMSAVERLKRWTGTIGVACGLGVLVAVVALASRVPLDGSVSVNASAARTPLSALFVLAVGAGLVALGAMAVVMRPGRRRRDDEPERERPPLQVHWAWKVVAILVPFALGAALLAAAVVGVRIFPGPGRPSAASPNHAAFSTPAPVRSTRSFELPSWLPWAVLGVLAVAVLVGGWLLLQRSRTLTDEVPRAPAAREAVEAAIVALDSTRDPRAAVIAAYAAMERTFAAHDLGRLAPEAPREYLRRVASANAASGDPAATITGLFEEARFSTHPIPETARARTLAGLSALRASVGAERGK
jgi:Domain of unknown function (DUF4129)